MEKVTPEQIRIKKSEIRNKSKKQNQKISMLTAYDFSFAKILPKIYSLQVLIINYNIGSFVIIELKIIGIVRWQRNILKS